MKEIGYMDVLKSVINKQNIPEKDVKKHFVPFVVVRWLSLDAKTCYVLNQLNIAPGVGKSYRGIDTLAEYKYIKQVVNLPRNKYIPFVKVDKDMELIITNLSNHFGTGRETVKQYMNILKGERLLELLDKLSMKDNRSIKTKKIIDLRNAITKKRKELKRI